MHVSVMTGPVLEYLAVRPDGVYIDATAGLGGHTAAIASQLESGLVFASDRDAESLALAEANTRQWTARIRFSHGPFSTLERRYRESGLPPAAGLLADLGVSRYQLTDAERGFSLQTDGPLDMRMDRSQGETAADLVNRMPEKALADLIYQLGEERRSRQIARAIVRARPIRSTLHLAGVVEQAAPRTGRIHPATRTFMALRLQVNRELEELEALLDAAPRLVGSGGRVVVLTFMSIEDRIVKQRFQRLSREGAGRLLTKHVVAPAEAEVRANPSARSAKLRAIEKN
jgi:16S rRNA (cytosine1402-N4)-methyltransferase